MRGGRTGATQSIRRWLLTRLLFGLAISGLVAAWGVYQLARGEASELFDYDLRAVATSLPRLGDSIRRSVATDVTGPFDGRMAITIWDRQGQLVFDSGPHVPAQRVPQGFHTVDHRGRAWRVFDIQQPDRFVQVAQPVSEVDEVAFGLALRTLQPLYVFFVAIIALMLWAVTQGLTPIRRLAVTLSARGGDSLKPIPGAARLPAEIRALVDELNALIARVDAISAAHRRFVADAAHELRTPLAALKLELQVASRDGSLVAQHRTLEDIEANLNHMIRMVAQMLMLAREQSKAPSTSIPAHHAAT